MNEDIFKEILAKAVDYEFAEFDNPPEHHFSFKHRLAMRFIFAKFEKNERRFRQKSIPKTQSSNEYRHHPSLKQRLMIATIIIILMTFLVGWVTIFVSGNFKGTVYPDNTHLNISDVESSLSKIDYRYVLASVPEGFEVIETNITPIHAYTLYLNSSTKKTISLHQWVKTSYNQHYNTEKNLFEEVTVNNVNGLCIDFSDDTSSSSLVVWDNGDYVIEIMADFDKENVLNLANLDKVL